METLSSPGHFRWEDPSPERSGSCPRPHSKVTAELSPELQCLFADWWTFHHSACSCPNSWPSCAKRRGRGGAWEGVPPGLWAGLPSQSTALARPDLPAPITTASYSGFRRPLASQWARLQAGQGEALMALLRPRPLAAISAQY